MKEREQTGIDSSTQRIPPKPTRETATGASSAREAFGQRAEPAGAAGPEHLGLERGEAGEPGTAPDRPYVSPSDRGAELQKDLPGPDEVPVMPASASGRDKLTPEEQKEEIDEESMYDRRPERDKDRPPSQRR